jgi:predicted Abi (CAAX) family protease
MNVSELNSVLIDVGLSTAVASPFITAGMRHQARNDRLKLIGLSGFIFVATSIATVAPFIFGLPEHGWNWMGKLGSILMTALLLPMLPKEALQRSGLFVLPTKDSTFAILGSFLLCALLSSIGDPGLPVNMETLAFQLTMPGLSEEPVFRAILPALLSMALGSPWKFAGAQLGWWWLALGVIFGAGHSLHWSPADGLAFQAIPFFTTGLIGLCFGWLAARCGSVWPCVICHGLINSTGLAIALATR